MANRQKDSSKLRSELDQIPLTPETLELRQWYWKQIADARKRELQSKKLSAKRTKEAKKEKKLESKPSGGLNPGLARFLESKKGDL